MLWASVPPITIIIERRIALRLTTLNAFENLRRVDRPVEIPTTNRFQGQTSTTSNRTNSQRFRPLVILFKSIAFIWTPFPFNAINKSRFLSWPHRPLSGTPQCNTHPLYSLNQFLYCDYRLHQERLYVMLVPQVNHRNVFISTFHLWAFWITHIVFIAECHQLLYRESPTYPFINIRIWFKYPILPTFFVSILTDPHGRGFISSTYILWLLASFFKSNWIKPEYFKALISLCVCSAISLLSRHPSTQQCSSTLPVDIVELVWNIHHSQLLRLRNIPHIHIPSHCLQQLLSGLLIDLKPDCVVRQKKAAISNHSRFQQNWFFYRRSPMFYIWLDCNRIFHIP